MMHNLSMTQALSIWSDLDDAYYGQHGFGGHVAEIYIYRLMARDPIREARLKPGLDPEPEPRADTIRANESLRALLLHFASMREAMVRVDGRLLELWSWPESHRLHIEVRPK